MTKPKQASQIHGNIIISNNIYIDSFMFNSI